ncbi:hypothetical protein HT574_13440 [Parageobacillus sp. VR-IP]|uniref:hypothetical protein n=1 Tax=Parageobacillus sp. VR-IP TaxID=2742205 RepID=UPI0015814128|nr:hypothetical protein [Parageobacillus sp. VR-IP]NUK31053.1 hypothetical protein [Parageobacillus sp. VR-IP]
MAVQIILHDNTTITAEMTDYNATDLAAKLNDPKILMVAIGNIVVNKQSVKLIAPVQQQ